MKLPDQPIRSKARRRRTLPEGTAASHSGEALPATKIRHVAFFCTPALPGVTASGLASEAAGAKPQTLSPRPAPSPGWAPQSCEAVVARARSVRARPARASTTLVRAHWSTAGTPRVVDSTIDHRRPLTSRRGARADLDANRQHLHPTRRTYHQPCGLPPLRAPRLTAGENGAVVRHRRRPAVQLPNHRHPEIPYGDRPLASHARRIRR